MSDDIVARLRRFTANNRDWPTIADAADEIERLREMNFALNDEAKNLRADRDEARRLMEEVRDAR